MAARRIMALRRSLPSGRTTQPTPIKWGRLCSETGMARRGARAADAPPPPSAQAEQRRGMAAQ